MRLSGNSVFHRTVLALCLLLPLAACGLFTSKESRALRRLPEYRDGYNDGCGSAQERDADISAPDPLRRDDQMYGANRAYHAGWNAGFNACRTRYASPQDASMPPDHGPIRDVNPGGGVLP